MVLPEQILTFSKQQTLKHSPNGRFVAVCGDGEYLVYTALVRNIVPSLLEQLLM
jgi:hypothetical protein